MEPRHAASPVVALPPPRRGQLGELLSRRRSVKSFASEPGTAGVELAELGELLWCGYGRHRDGGAVVPSAHALYPLSVAVIVGGARGLATGAYSYQRDEHALVPGIRGDHRRPVADTTFADRDWLTSASVLLVITAAMGPANEHFADQPPRERRGERYVWLEAGHLSQNIYLAATELGLGAVLVAGFDDEPLQSVLSSVTALPVEVTVPLGILAIGVPATGRGHQRR